VIPIDDTLEQRGGSDRCGTCRPRGQAAPDYVRRGWASERIAARLGPVRQLAIPRHRV